MRKSYSFEDCRKIIRKAEGFDSRYSLLDRTHFFFSKLAILNIFLNIRIEKSSKIIESIRITISKHRNKFCHELSCHEMSCHEMSCHELSCHELSCHELSCHELSCHELSVFRIQCVTISIISTVLFVLSNLIT